MLFLFQTQEDYVLFLMLELKGADPILKLNRGGGELFLDQGDDRPEAQLVAVPEKTGLLPKNNTACRIFRYAAELLRAFLSRN